MSSTSWTPSTDPERIPEVRHNLRLIADACKSDLDGLALEAKALEERKKWLVNEDLRLRKKVEEEAESTLILSSFIYDLGSYDDNISSDFANTANPFSRRRY